MSFEELTQQIGTLSAQKAAAEQGLLAKKAEAVSLIRTTVVDLLIAIREDPKILAKGLVIRKKKSAHAVVFEITLDEKDLINRQDYTQALSTVSGLSKLVGAEPIVVEED